MPSDLQTQLRHSLWRDNASYLPMIVYQDAYYFSNRRPNLHRLIQPKERRRIIAVQLSDFYGFFDAVADAMRAAIDEVVI